MKAAQSYRAPRLTSDERATNKHPLKKEATEVRVQLNLRFIKGSGGFLCSNLTLKRVAVEVPFLKCKRRKYDLKQKQKIVDLPALSPL